MQSSGRWGKDASHSSGLKYEVGTPQTQTCAQCPTYPPDPQQDVTSSSTSGTSQDAHSLIGPAGGLKTPKKQRSRVRGWQKHSGQDVKQSSPNPDPKCYSANTAL